MTGRPTRSTIAGSAYLDLRRHASTTGRPTDELLRLYGLEGFLDRLVASPFADQFVLKGGVLLAAFGARRPTRDIDFAAIDLADDLESLAEIVNQVIGIRIDDGLEFDPDSTSAEPIRSENAASGGRITLQARLSTARIQFHVDINLGDPIWPDPEPVDLPRILGGKPIRLTGYRVELVLAEKIVTAMQRGTANTRWRDFVDIASLADQATNTDKLTEAIHRVAEHRQVTILPLSDTLDGYAPIAQRKWVAWRRKQQLADSTPESFAELLGPIIEFVDPLILRPSV